MNYSQIIYVTVIEQSCTILLALLLVSLIQEAGRHYAHSYIYSQKNIGRIEIIAIVLQITLLIFSQCLTMLQCYYSADKG